jgi:hypothetical protein
MQHAAVDRLDLLRRLLPFEHEQRLALTVSPGFLSQPVNTPSSIDQPSRGIVTSAAIVSHAPKG